jgi:hypothetical protein
VLRVYGAALAVLNVLTVQYWRWSGEEAVMRRGTEPICWPLVPNCADWRVLTDGEVPGCFRCSPSAPSSSRPCSCNDGSSRLPGPGCSRSTWLGQGRAVITDRLHAHVFCLLLGIPHCLLDNSYGKVRGCWETWTCGTHLAVWCNDEAEALERVRTLPGRG